MAKKFLDVLGEAFEEDILNDVIPKQKQSPPPKKRKKRFMDSLNQFNSSTKSSRKGKSQKRKSLLDTMEEALDNQVFDQLFPESKDRPTTRDKKAKRVVESPFSTMITTEVLDRAREIARLKGLRVKDVINAALKLYVEKELEEEN